MIPVESVARARSHVCIVSLCHYRIIGLFCRNISLIVANAGEKSSINSSAEYDYDLVIIGAGVGGHGAALHAVDKVWWCN